MTEFLFWRWTIRTPTTIYCILRSMLKRIKTSTSHVSRLAVSWLKLWLPDTTEKESADKCNRYWSDVWQIRAVYHSDTEIRWCSTLLFNLSLEIIKAGFSAFVTHWWLVRLTDPHPTKPIVLMQCILNISYQINLNQDLIEMIRMVMSIQQKNIIIHNAYV